jgi:voltage-gated potassium channel Kch
MSIWIFFLSSNETRDGIIETFLVLVLSSAILTLIISALVITQSDLHEAIMLWAAFFVAILLSFASIYAVFQQALVSGCIEKYSAVPDFLYFSYTTLTTLGYGDLKPLGICRLFTSVEAVLGYIGLGVVTASTYKMLSRRNKNRSV